MCTTAVFDEAYFGAQEINVLSTQTLKTVLFLSKQPTAEPQNISHKTKPDSDLFLLVLKNENSKE